jgi:hypothetical protein
MSAEQSTAVMAASDEEIWHALDVDEKYRDDMGGVAAGAFAPGPRVLADLLIKSVPPGQKLRKAKTF